MALYSYGVFPRWSDSMVPQGLSGPTTMQGLMASCLSLSLAGPGLPGISTLKRVVCALAILLVRVGLQASRRERRDGWTLTVRSLCFASCLKSREDPNTGLQDSFVRRARPRGARICQFRLESTSSRLSPSHLTCYNRVKALT